jgi:glycosyltransferase involved in cell wall biosynthesis
MHEDNLKWENALRSLIRSFPERERYILDVYASFSNGHMPLPFYCLPSGATVLFSGMGSGLPALRLAAQDPHHRIFCVEQSPYDRKKLEALLPDTGFQNIFCFATHEEADEAIRRLDTPIHLMSVEAGSLSQQRLAEYLESHKVHALVGTYDNAVADDVELYRLSALHTRQFRWVHTTTRAVLSGNSWTDLEVSIVVAADEASAETLRDCLSSLIQQTLVRKQIICVFPSSSTKIPDMLASLGTDNNIQAIALDNWTRGAAFNNGRELAKGRYVTFVDGTDWYDLGMFEALYGHACLHHADIVRCDYRFIRFSDGGSDARHMMGLIPRDTRQYFGFLGSPLDLVDLDPMIGRCLYRRAMLEDNALGFVPENIGYDDAYLHFICAASAARAYIVPDIYFNRRELPPTPAQEPTNIMDERVCVLSRKLRAYVAEFGSYNTEITFKRLQTQLHMETLAKLSGRRILAYGQKMLKDIFDDLYYVNTCELALRLARWAPRIIRSR